MRNLTRAQLIYVMDPEAFERHWSTLGEAFAVQDRRARAVRAADSLLDQGYDVVPPDGSTVPVVPATVYTTEGY